MLKRRCAEAEHRHHRGQRAQEGDRDLGRLRLVLVFTEQWDQNAEIREQIAKKDRIKKDQKDLPDRDRNSGKSEDIFHAHLLAYLTSYDVKTYVDTAAEKADEAYGKDLAHDQGERRHGRKHDLIKGPARFVARDGITCEVCDICRQRQYQHIRKEHGDHAVTGVLFVDVHKFDASEDLAPFLCLIRHIERFPDKGFRAHLQVTWDRVARVVVDRHMRKIRKIDKDVAFVKFFRADKFRRLLFYRLKPDLLVIKRSDIIRFDIDPVKKDTVRFHSLAARFRLEKGDPDRDKERQDRKEYKAEKKALLLYDLFHSYILF